MFCKYCGKEMNEGAVFCSNCGMCQDAPVAETPVADMPSAQNTAAQNTVAPKLDAGKKKEKSGSAVRIAVIAIIAAIVLGIVVVAGAAIFFIGGRSGAQKDGKAEDVRAADTDNVPSTKTVVTKKEVNYNSEDTTEFYWYEDEYDAKGKLTKHVRHLNGNKMEWEEYEYDAKGKLIKTLAYHADGSGAGWSEYEYDDSGNQIKAVHYSQDGTKVSWTEYEYDAAGNQTKRASYDKDGSISREYEYQYDSYGNVVYEKQGNLLNTAHGGYSIYTYTYTYQTIE